MIDHKNLKELAEEALLPWSVAEFRFYLSKADYNENFIAGEYVYAACNAVPELLSELEEAQEEKELMRLETLVKREGYI